MDEENPNQRRVKRAALLCKWGVGGGLAGKSLCGQVLEGGER